MSKLPVLSGKECLDLFLHNGFQKVRQVGSHIIIRKNNPFAQLIIPDHKELDKGTLRAIIRQSGLTIE
jgi:predicted RNA binding protein YcfA (HicA-like mRNA interferase family)